MELVIIHLKEPKNAQDAKMDTHLILIPPLVFYVKQALFLIIMLIDVLHVKKELIQKKELLNV